jgi:WD40 repeat protein
MMKRAFLATAVVATFCFFQLHAWDSVRNVVGLDFAKSTGLVAAAYEGGQVMVWELESGRVRNVLNTFGLKSNLNRPLAHFSPDGHRIAYTTDGDAGLVLYDLEKGTSTPIVPRRLLYLGIAAFRWSNEDDSLLVAIGRDITLVNANGRIVWQRRLETKSLISDVVWHPDEHSYTVATDDTTVSSYDTVTGQIIASSVLDSAAHAVPVKIGWSRDGAALIAGLARKALMVLDPQTLKTKKSIPCNCADFAWNPARR